MRRRRRLRPPSKYTCRSWQSSGSIASRRAHPDIDSRWSRRNSTSCVSSGSSERRDERPPAKQPSGCAWHSISGEARLSPTSTTHLLGPSARASRRSACRRRELRVAADLDLGLHEDLVPELDGLVREYPFRERLRGQLMVALYRSGRQADALEALREGRRLPDEELGCGPAMSFVGSNVPSSSRIRRWRCRPQPSRGRPLAGSQSGHARSVVPPDSVALIDHGDARVVGHVLSADGLSPSLLGTVPSGSPTRTMEPFPASILVDGRSSGRSG